MKKVLIVTYYWPPSGGVGVLRCLKFAKYLQQYGWDPIIYTADNAQYPYIDNSNDGDIPSNITVLKHPIWEPFNLYKKISGLKQDHPVSNPLVVKEKKSFLQKISIWVRANFFIPDARCFWIKPSVKFLSKYLENHKIDAILSDGPPHTNTVIACQLSKKFNIPWLADFQDPWTQVDYYSLFPIGKRAHAKHSHLERETFRYAKKITIASPTWKLDLEKIGAKNVEVIYWGYDEDDFKQISSRSAEKFTIFHAGLLGYDRLSIEFFEALKELKNEIPSFANDLQIQLYGMVDKSILNCITEYELEVNTIIKGTAPRKLILQQMSQAYILFLPLNKSMNIDGRLPGKLYEYLRSFRWIFALGPDTSDVADILKETQSGSIVPYEDKMAIKAELKKYYSLFQQGKYPTSDASRIESYDVAQQTKKIASYLTEITTR